MGPPATDAPGPILYLFSQGSRDDPRHPDAWLLALSEPALLARLDALDARWLVLEGDAPFFEVTKRLHNHLYGGPGDGGELGPAAHAVYDAVEKANADELLTFLRPEDIVVQGVSGEEDNAFEVRVEEMEFLGSFYRAELSDVAMGEARLRADFSINLVRRLEIDAGRSMSVRVPRECIRIYGASHG